MSAIRDIANEFSDELSAEIDGVDGERVYEILHKALKRLSLVPTPFVAEPCLTCQYNTADGCCAYYGSDETDSYCDCDVWEPLDEATE